MPATIVTRLSDTIRRILAMPDIAARFENEGVDVGFQSPEEFSRLIKADIERWSNIAKVVTIKE